MKMDMGLMQQFVKWSGLPVESIVASDYASASDSSVQIPNRRQANAEIPTSPRWLSGLTCVAVAHFAWKTRMTGAVRRSISYDLLQNSQVVLVVLDRTENGKRLTGRHRTRRCEN